MGPGWGGVEEVGLRGCEVIWAWWVIVEVEEESRWGWREKGEHE
jgi:hypothetical protein